MVLPTSLPQASNLRSASPPWEAWQRLLRRLRTAEIRGKEVSYLRMDQGTAPLHVGGLSFFSF